MIKYKLNPKYEADFKDFLLNIKEYFHTNNQTIHKARNELKIIQHNDVDVVVKAFKVPNIINRIAYSYLRDGKACKSYEYSLKIGSFTPEPIGYIEFHDGGLLKESYFVSEKFAYDFTIREPLLDKNFPASEEIFRAFARFSYDLHEAGIFHNDYSPGNILIKKEEDGYIFKIVDINRMKFFDSCAMDQTTRAKNFSKLWSSDVILRIMADEYKKYYSCDEKFESQVLYFSNKNKQIKNFKKRLKGIEVND
jgi:serine/threonine protein kinase